LFFKPALFWAITEIWKSNDATEPSDLYIWHTRFGGVMCSLVGFAGILTSIFL
jgi:hypothetical protein